MLSNYRYGAEAVVLLGIAYSLIRWVVRTSIELRQEKTSPSFPVAVTESVPLASAEPLRARGLVTDAQLAQMTPRERHLLLTVAAPRLAKSDRGTAGRPARPTPIRPVGAAIYCPACGALLSREEIQTLGATTCPKCVRRVAGHFQRGRVTVIVDETADEAEHRKRMEGGE
jgi:hypothetical protein